jgi:hypothetical protein
MPMTSTFALAGIIKMSLRRGSIRGLAGPNNRAWLYGVFVLPGVPEASKREHSAVNEIDGVGLLIALLVPFEEH